MSNFTVTNTPDSMVIIVIEGKFGSDLAAI